MLKSHLGFDVFVRQRIRLYGINNLNLRTTDLVEKEKGYGYNVD